MCPLPRLALSSQLSASCWLWASYPGNKSAINRPTLALVTLGDAVKLHLEPSVRAQPWRDPASSQDSVLTTLLQGPLVSPSREPRPCQVHFPTQKGAEAYKTVPSRYRMVL